MGVKAGDEVIPASFLKVEGRGTLIGVKDWRGTNRRIGKWSEPRSCSTSQEQEKAKEEGAKELSGKERLPEERWKRLGVSESLRGGGQRR